MRILVPSLLLLVVFSANAQDALFNCKFEPSPSAPTDKDVKAWHDDSSFLQRDFVMQFDPPKIVDGPKPSGIWGEPRIEVGPQEITLKWGVKVKPLDRWPEINLTINRFSGKAFESYAMLKAPRTGPAYAYWGRFGKCEINTRKF